MTANATCVSSTNLHGDIRERRRSDLSHAVNARVAKPGRSGFPRRRCGGEEYMFECLGGRLAQNAGKITTYSDEELPAQQTIPRVFGIVLEVFV